MAEALYLNGKVTAATSILRSKLARGAAGTVLAGLFLLSGMLFAPRLLAMTPAARPDSKPGNALLAQTPRALGRVECLRPGATPCKQPFHRLASEARTAHL